VTGPAHDITTTTVPRRADAGVVRLGRRDIDGLVLCAEQSGAPTTCSRGRWARSPPGCAGSWHGGGGPGSPPPGGWDPARPGAGSLPAAWPQPGSATPPPPADVAGLIAWFAVTGRADLAPPPRR
jgi:hypothetical protein